jgi:hypothetical protein
MGDPTTDLPLPDVEAEPETPTARRRRDQATSVQIGRARVAYLDALAADRALPGRTAALLSIWTRSALDTAGRLALPALPPAAAPTDAPVRVKAEAVRPIDIVQLGGPEWQDYRADILALVERSGAPLSRIVRAVIDAHMVAHGGAVGVCEP